MADLSYYFAPAPHGLELRSEAAAFDAFVASLQTYYDAAYYVDWAKVWANVTRFNREFHLLSSLCDAADIVTATRELLRDYPRVVCALPALLACRGSISILEDAKTAHVETFDFAPKDKLCDAEIERYARFIGESGLLELLANIKSVPDYMTGVEVGCDTNGRKNRSGELAVRALMPHIESVQLKHPEIAFWPERTHSWLAAHGCKLPDEMDGFKWDGAFFSPASGKWVLMEINHYGTVGSKPAAIVNDYIARERELLSLGVGFLWVTDGWGWLKMGAPLRRAWNELRFLTTIQMARDGLLEHALISMLGAK